MSIKVKEVTKYYGEQKALDQVSFEIKTGEVVGFLGPNGAGKSTLMKIITGFISADSGSVNINELDVKEHSQEVKKMIGYLPEHNPLYLDMYVKEYLEFTANIYRIKNKKEQIKKLIIQTGLEAEKHKKIGALSKGYRQRVGLAQSLIHNPKVLILDEPTSGLDPNQIIEIRHLIKSISKEKTIMLSTHIMQEVEAICDKVIIINKGKIVAADFTHNIQKQSTENKQIILVEFDKNTTSEKLKSVEGIENLHLTENKQWLIESEKGYDLREKLFRFAVANDLAILTMQQQEKSLEDTFIELTKNTKEN